MSTAIQGVVLNPYGWVPIRGVTVEAFSTDGATEGSATTDSNGWFSLTGLTNRNWLAKLTTAPPFVGNLLILPTNVDHLDLTTVTADQHHAGFVALLDNAGNAIAPNANDLIQVTDDGVINADAGGDESVLALTIDQAQISHGSIGGTEDDDHTQYAAVAGRGGGQFLVGGTASGESLTLASTSHSTKGSLYLGSSALGELDETAGQLKLPTSGSSAGLMLGGDALLYRVSADTLRTPDALTVDGAVIASSTLSVGGDIDMNGANIDEGGVIFLKEQADADADVAGSGQIWVNTATPNELYFTDDAGTDIPLNAQAGIPFMIDGGGSAIAVGIAGWMAAPFACTIKAARLLADQSGAIKVDIWADTYANYPPTNADTITGGEEPEIAASGVKDEDTALTSWTTALAKGDIIYYYVDSCATIERCLVMLEVDKT